MALPVSRSTTYVNEAAPAINADDLNDLQDWCVYLNKAFAFGVPSFGMSIFREEWTADIGVIGGGGSTGFNTRWTSFSSGALGTVSTLAAGTDYPASALHITPGTAATNHSTAYSVKHIVAPTSTGVIIAEFDFCPRYSFTNVVWDLGLCSTGGADTIYPSTNNVDTLRFTADATLGSTWYAVNNDDSGAATTTAIAASPTIDVWQRFRIEYHGAATPVGVSTYGGKTANTAKGIFWIDGSRQLVVDSKLPTDAMALFFRGYCIGVATGEGKVGPALVNFSRYANTYPLEQVSGS